LFHQRCNLVLSDFASLQQLIRKPLDGRPVLFNECFGSKIKPFQKRAGNLARTADPQGKIGCNCVIGAAMPAPPRRLPSPPAVCAD